MNNMCWTNISFLSKMFSKRIIIFQKFIASMMLKPILRCMMGHRGRIKFHMTNSCIYSFVHKFLIKNFLSMLDLFFSSKCVTALYWVNIIILELKLWKLTAFETKDLPSLNYFNLKGSGAGIWFCFFWSQFASYFSFKLCL